MDHTVTKIMWTETAHRLVNYQGKCAHLHGHSYRWEVSASGPLDERGMVLDFADLKDTMEQVIGPLDHALVLYEEDPILKGIPSWEGVLDLFRSTNGDDPRLHIMGFNPTAEELAAWAGEEMQDVLPMGGVTITEIKLWETAKSFVVWRP